MGLTSSQRWILTCLAVLAACAGRPGTDTAILPEYPRDSLVSVERISGMPFATPLGIDTLIVVPNAVVLYVGDSLLTGSVRVSGRDSTGAAIAIPAPAYAFAAHDVAELRGGFLLAAARAAMALDSTWN